MTYTFADYLLHLFYLIDTEIKALNLPRLRERGPGPILSDAEAITIELAGEFLGIDGDEQIYEHFRRYHAGEFPALALICRTTFARQCANLWRVNQLLHARLVDRMPLRDPVDGSADCWIVDSFPLRVCRLRRVPRSKLFKGQAAYGHDPAQGRDAFWGFRVHVRCDRRGPMAQVELTPANVADLDAVRALAPPPDAPGPLIGDRNYWTRDPGRLGDLARAGIELLLAPFKKASSDPTPGRSRALNRLRRRVETVIGQLADRFNAQRTRARDLWHLCARLTRKALSYTAAVLINWMAGNPPLQLDRLIQG